MRNLIFVFLFVLGLSGAFLGIRYFGGDSNDDAKNIAATGEYCNMACCVPYQGELSDSQEQTLMSLGKNYCLCRDRLSREIDNKRLALADMLLQKDPDMTAIESLLKETANLQVELEKETIKHILGIKEQLEPEKQEQFIKPIVVEVRKRCFHRDRSENLSSGPSRYQEK